MSILQPLALLGLLTIPVIVILHLLRERSRRHVVPSLELWAWLQSEVRGPKPRQLPWSWILLLQMVVALLLTLALIRPQLRLPLPTSEAERLILIVDTSTSMSAQDVRPTRLAEAQTRAGARMASLGGDDSVVLISAGPVAQWVGDSGDVGLPSLLTSLAELQPAGVGNDWPAALALASAATVPGLSNRVVVFTDGAYELPESLSNTALPARLEWVLIGNAEPNQAVVTLAARTAASGALQVFTRIANFSDAPSQRVITLLAGGETVDSSQVLLNAAGTVEHAWTLPPGVATVEVRLSGADALPADDRAALGLPLGQSVDALLVADDPADFERALRALPNLRLQTVTPPSYVAFEPHDLTVFQGWLPDEWPDGGVLVVDPPVTTGLLPVAGQVAVGELNRVAPSDDPLLADISLDNVTFGPAALVQAPQWLAPVLSDSNGTGLVWRGAVASTRLVVMSFNLEDTNLTRRSAFPVLVANAVAELVPSSLPESVRPGQAVPLPSSQAVPTLTLTDPEGQSHSFGADRPSQFTGTGRPGLYVLEGLTPDGEPWRGGFGVNAGAAGESDLRLRASPVADQEITGGPVSVPGPVPLADLWPFLVLLVLVFVFAEAQLAWR
jgi:hypothetical protein